MARQIQKATISACMESISDGEIRGWIEGMPGACLILLHNSQPVSEIHLSPTQEHKNAPERYSFIFQLPEDLSLDSHISVIEKNSKYAVPMADSIRSNYKDLLKKEILRNIAGMGQQKRGEIVAKSGLFDAEWYLRTFGDIAEHAFFAKNPLLHWLEYGFAEGRNPSASFDCEYYVTKNKLTDLEAACNALLHYQLIGRYNDCQIYAFGRPHSKPHQILLEERHQADKNARIFSDFIKAIDTDGIFNGTTPLIPSRKNDEVKVSVILPFYNRFDTLPHSAASVLAQTHNNLELLLIDDGGEPDYDNVLAPILADPRVRPLRIQHAGVSAARNAGLKAASGEYICFLDSDNIWNPAFLDSMLYRMKKEQASCAYSGMHRYLNGKFSYFFQSFDKKTLLRENFIDINSAIFHSSLLNGEYFDEALYRLNDWDFLIRIFKKQEPLACNFPGLAYFAMCRGDRITDIPVSQKAYIINKHAPFIDWAAQKQKRRVPNLVSIIIPVRGQNEHMLQCLRSVADNTAAAYEIILIDNKDNEILSGELLNYLAGREHMQYVRDDGPYNWSMACSLGFSRSSGEYVCFLNKNITVSPGWLEALLSAIQIGADFAMPVCEQNGSLKGGMLISPFSQVPYAAPFDPQMQKNDFPSSACDGPCVLMKAGDFIGQKGFDPRFVENGAMLFHTLRATMANGGHAVVAVKSRVRALEAISPDDYGWWDWRTFSRLKNFCVLCDDAAFYASLGFFPYGYEMGNSEHPDGAVFVKKVKLADRKILAKKDLSILLIKPSGIGNMLFTMPLVKALKDMFPQAAIDIMCFREEASIAALEARRVFALKRTTDSVNGWKESLSKACASLRYDLVMLPPNTIDRNIPGVETAGAIIISHPWLDWQNKHEAEHDMDLARMLGWRGPCPAWRYPVNNSAKRICADPYIAAHIGASDSAHMRKKLWPLEKWAKLMEFLTKNYHIYLVEGPNEHAVNQKLLNMLDSATRGKIIIKKTDSVAQCANYLRHAEAMISLDGGIGHLANHIGIPLAMIFGPTSMAKGAPYCSFAPAAVLGPDGDITCAPCYPAQPDRLMDCQHRQCLKNVTPEKVLKALENMGIAV